MGGAGYKDRVGGQQHRPRNGRVVTLLNSRASPSDLSKDPVMWSLQYAWCPRGKLSPKCDPPLATARTGESVRKAEVYPLQRILLRTSRIDVLTEAGSSRKQGTLHPCLDSKAATVTSHDPQKPESLTHLPVRMIRSRRAAGPWQPWGSKSRPHLWFLLGSPRGAGQRPACRKLSLPLGAQSRLETTDSHPSV